MRICDIRMQFCLAHFTLDLKFLATLPDAATAAYGERLLLPPPGNRSTVTTLPQNAVNGYGAL